jgi:hypothetical protein
MKTKWLRVSIIAQVTLVLYFQVVQWVPLGRWNYQPGFDPLVIQIIHGHIDIQDVGMVGCFILPVFVFWFALWRGLTWIMWVGLLGYLGWLTMEIQTWWIAYIFGASDTWMSVYQRVFSRSVQLLPSFGRHLAPDGMHLVLHMLLATVVLSTLFGLIDHWRARIQAQKSK